MTRIGSGMALAFIALLPATAATAQQPVVVQGALCRGEEPFWQLEASRTTAVLNRLAIKGNREVIFHGAPQAFMFLQPAAVIWRGDSTHLPKETLVVTLREDRRGECARSAVGRRRQSAFLSCARVAADGEVRQAGARRRRQGRHQRLPPLRSVLAELSTADPSLCSG